MVPGLIFALTGCSSTDTRSETFNKICNHKRILIKRDRSEMFENVQKVDRIQYFSYKPNFQAEETFIIFCPPYLGVKIADTTGEQLLFFFLFFRSW